MKLFSAFFRVFFSGLVGSSERYCDKKTPGCFYVVKTFLSDLYTFFKLTVVIPHFEMLELQNLF